MIVCPDCGLELNSTYIMGTVITNQHHPNKKCSGDGIGKKGVIDNTPQQSKKQQKIAATQAAAAKNDAHKVAQSERNMNTYQTRHKDDAVQQARVEKAGQVGLGGHASANSNSKQNNNTTGGLAAINKATKK